MYRSPSIGTALWYDVTVVVETGIGVIVLIDITRTGTILVDTIVGSVVTVVDTVNNQS